MRRRQRLAVEDVKGGARDRPRRERVEQRALVDDRAARGVDEIGVRRHQRELAGADQPGRAIAEPRVDADDVGARQQVLERRRRDPQRGRAGGVEVLAPGEHRHPEREPVAGDAGALASEPDQAERAAEQLRPERVLPAAGADPGVLLVDPPRQPQDQRPGQLGGRRRRRLRAGDDDPARPRRGEVDRRVPHAGRHQQRQPRQALEQRAREWRSLAHRDDHLETRQPLRERVLVVEVVVEGGQLDGVAEPLPAAQRPCDSLVVVERRDRDGCR